MDKQDEQLLRVSFMLSEQGKDLETLSEDLKKLYSQINVGDKSIVVRVKLTEREVEKLIDLVKNKENFLTAIELEKVKKSATITNRIWVVTGIIATAILSNLSDIIDSIRSFLGK